VAHAADLWLELPLHFVISSLFTDGMHFSHE
jgi:hypothetical protein